MKGLGAALAGVTAVLTGCTYYNAVYNAERLYEQAESDLRAGRDSLAELRYREVARRTAEAYRADPAGERAGELLLLLGRAQLRTGEVRAAQLALEEALAREQDPELRPRILVDLGRALLRGGDPEGALARADEALELAPEEPVRAEAFLLRGSALLARGPGEEGWGDLERAAAAGGEVRVEAGLERLAAAVRHGRRQQAREAIATLLDERGAAERLDSIGLLIDAAAKAWNPSVAAGLLAAVDSSRWDRVARGRVRLTRARLLHQAGDTASATDQALLAAEGRDAAAAEARLELARWLLGRTRDLGDIETARTLLLPSGDDPRVARVLDALDEVDRYAALGLEQPLGWFRAAELARDELQAPVLARGLFLAYADSEPDAPWAAKALLAALAVTPWEEDRAWLRGRLEVHRHSPYVLAARGGSSEGVEALDRELQVRLDEIGGP